MGDDDFTDLPPADPLRHRRGDAAGCWLALAGGLLMYATLMTVVVEQVFRLTCR